MDKSGKGTQAQISSDHQGTLRLSGSLVFPTVTAVLHEYDTRFRDQTFQRLDLADIDQVDSAGMALVIAILSRVKPYPQVVNVPADLAALAEVCDVDALMSTSSTMV